MRRRAEEMPPPPTFAAAEEEEEEHMSKGQAGSRIRQDARARTCRRCARLGDKNQKATMANKSFCS